MYLSGDFRDQQSTTRALLDLKASGFNADNIDIFSDEPVELPAGALDRPSRMSLGVVSIALVFLLLVIAFVYFTQHDYPLITGGMPLFSFWPTGVVFYELTMFGAIATTFIWFLFEAGLVRRHKRAPTPPEVQPGTIRVRVSCEPGESDAGIRCLESAGAIAVMKGGEEV